MVDGTELDTFPSAEGPRLIRGPSHPGPVLDVVVVDDEETLAAALDFALEGFSFRPAGSGAAMWSEIQARMPDLVLMDIQLGGESGITVCAELKANPATRELPVVVLSGLLDSRVRAMALAAGASDFLTKPFRPLLLAERMRHAREPAP